MKRFERQGLYGSDLTLLRNVSRSIQARVRELGSFSGPANGDAPGRNNDTARIMDVHTCLFVMILEHSEVSHPFCSTRAFAQRGLAIAIDYLFGEWREGFVEGGVALTRQQTRERWEWLETYSIGLFFALCLQDERALTILTQWPGIDAKREDLDYKPQDIDYNIALAHFLRGIPTVQSMKLLSAIRSGTPLRPKLLLATLEAIEGADSDGYSACLQKLLKSFLKRGYAPDQLHASVNEASVSLEGSILWQLARRARLQQPELPIELDDLIVKENALS